MQAASFGIWTRQTDLTFYGNNRFTKSASCELIPSLKSESSLFIHTSLIWENPNVPNRDIPAEIAKRLNCQN